MNLSRIGIIYVLDAEDALSNLSGKDRDCQVLICLMFPLFSSPLVQEYLRIMTGQEPCGISNYESLKNVTCAKKTELDAYIWDRQR